MKSNQGFWDTSALATLCVYQNASANFRKLWQQSSRVVVWWGTAVEIRSALSRLQRGNFMNAQGVRFALNRLEAMRQQWHELTPSEKLRDLAETLPDVYGLTSLDSFQLAAALVWCREKPKGRLFICDDVKLSEAAQKAGFSIRP